MEEDISITLRSNGKEVSRQYRNQLSALSMSETISNSKISVDYYMDEHYTLKQRLQVYFIKNQRSSLLIRLFNFFIKVLSCLLYVLRVAMDNPKRGQGCLCMCSNVSEHVMNGNMSMSLSMSQTLSASSSNSSCSNDEYDYRQVNWLYIVFVERSTPLWIMQTIVAFISLSETCLLTYLSYKGNIRHSILSASFLLELINTVPLLVTVVNYRRLKCLFVPVFLNCWLAKQQLDNMFSDLNRVFQRSSSILSQRILNLAGTSICLIFTSVCGVQHLQRGGGRNFTMFESLWFVMVTFSTVGYGDYRPDIWPSMSFMIIMIIVAITVLPSQLEKLAFTWIERNRMGGEYSRHRAKTERHVVFCATTLNADIVMDFLNEFYSHPNVQDYYVVLLSPCELNDTMKMILQIPIWAERVIYIRGSALKDADLSRCGVQDAAACFILTARNCRDRGIADQHTILRSWAVKDFAPHCPQYVQLYRPENKIHVGFAEFVVCEDEFKYALLANNALCPGFSTFVTLLLHTSRGTEGQTSRETWHNQYGRCSGNEVYHIILKDSCFFGEFLGKSFTYASFHAHKKYGVALLAVCKDNGSIQLNPGPRHIMMNDDVCFYLALTKEENSKVLQLQQTVEVQTNLVKEEVPSPAKKPLASKSESVELLELNKKIKTPKKRKVDPINEPSVGGSGIYSNPSTEISNEKETLLTCPLTCRRPSIAAVPDTLMDDADYREAMKQVYYQHEIGDGDLPECVKGCPPVVPYIGTSPCLCRLVREKRPLCCLRLSEPCDHCDYECAHDYGWPNRAVILCADYASNGLYNFIIPLRSYWRSEDTLRPIILMLETEPDNYFLESLSYFPLVYWMKGCIENVNDLLRAGINFCDNVVIVNKESSNSAEEGILADCNTIVAVQTIYRLFPSTKIITELSQSSNMRFTQFQADDPYSHTISKLEKKERNRGSFIPFMFRLAFAGGHVFSASMLDTLLYQTFVKPYILDFVRLLLGIDQAVGSGHLTVMRITSSLLWIRTYGRLYQYLCSSTCEIPIGIFRTLQRKAPEPTSAVIHLGGPVSSNRILFNEVRKQEKEEISRMVQCRMLTLGLPVECYNKDNQSSNSLAFPLINPTFDTELQEDDIVYLIRPSSLSEKPSPLIDERKAQQGDLCAESFKRRGSNYRRRGSNATINVEIEALPSRSVSQIDLRTPDNWLLQSDQNNRNQILKTPNLLSVRVTCPSNSSNEC